MATPREYFQKDSSRYMSLDEMRTSTEKKSRAAAEVISRVAFDFEAGVKFVFLYIPDSPFAIDLINHYISDINEVLKVTDITSCAISLKGTDELISSGDLDFSGRVIVYTGTRIEPETKEALCTHARDKGLSLLIRDGAYP